jgi:RNase P subunit RPR2
MAMQILDANKMEFDEKGAVVPVVAMTCNCCGHIRQFSAVKLGFV